MPVIIRKIYYGEIIKEKDIDMECIPNKGDTIIEHGDEWIVAKRIFDIDNNRLIICIK